MNIKKLPKSQIELGMTIPADEFQKYLEAAANKISKDLRIDGFRPGKAPFEVVEKKVGFEKILAEGAESAIKKTYVEAVMQNKIDSIGEPRITVKKIAKGNDLEYTATVAVMPEVKLSRYRSEIKKIRKETDKEITAEEIQKELETLQKSRAKLVTVSRPAKKGDRVEIDFEVWADEKLIEGGKAENHPLTIGENYFIPGFEENLVGMEEKDSKEFDLEFPKDYHQKELAGKKATFKVSMKLVQEKELPPINDEFAKQLGKFDNLESLKKSIREGMETEQKKKNEEKWRTQVIEIIASSSEIDLPDILIEQELEKMMLELEQNVATMGLNLETYLENIKKSKNELLKGWKETADKRVRSALVLKEIAVAENIKVPANEIEEEINKAMAYYKTFPDMEKNVNMERLYTYIQGTLSNQKVFEFLEKIN